MSDASKGGRVRHSHASEEPQVLHGQPSMHAGAAVLGMVLERLFTKAPSLPIEPLGTPELPGGAASLSGVGVIFAFVHAN